MGDISTHVISKLGSPSVAGAAVRLFFNESMDAGFLDAGWSLIKTTALSDNGGNDELVPQGELKRGLYLVECTRSTILPTPRRSHGWLICS